MTITLFILAVCGDTTTSSSSTSQPRISSGLEYTRNIADDLMRFPTANQGRLVPFYDVNVSEVRRIQEGGFYFDRVTLGSFDLDGANVMVMLNGPANADIGLRAGDTISVYGTFLTVNRNPIGFLNEYSLLFNIADSGDDAVGGMLDASPTLDADRTGLEADILGTWIAEFISEPSFSLNSTVEFFADGTGIETTPVGFERNFVWQVTTGLGADGPYTFETIQTILTFDMFPFDDETFGNSA